MSSFDSDIFSPDLYAVAVPHARFERLRREEPISWHEEPGGPGFWAVTKHRDVLEISRDAGTFSSERGGVQIPDLPRGDLRVSPDAIANMDPPRHTRYRALVQQSFTPQGLAKMETWVQRRVERLVTDVAGRATFDFMEDFASKLPMATILEMVGVPSGDEEKLGSWIMQLLAPDDAEYRTSPEERAVTTDRFMRYAHDLAAQRREAPKDDLLSRLMAAEVEGQKLTYAEFGMFFVLLLAAGTHSTTITLGNAMQLLIEHPEQRARLRDDLRLASSAVEEVLRFSPPILHFRRTATRDTELRGRKVAAGQKVVLWYVSANRDEEVFRDPNTFDISRTPNDHVSFGYGPHFCLGNALARMTVRVALTECLLKMPELSLAEAPERLRSNWFNGMKRMPVANGNNL